MATTTYFEELITDEANCHKPFKLEFGTMTALNNGGNLYLRIDDGDAVLVDSETARRLLSELEGALAYIGVVRP